MNPIKTAIFLLTIAIIIFAWLFILASVDNENDLGRGFKLIYGALAIVEISFFVYLSVYIPYSVYWLMSIWNW